MTKSQPNLNKIFKKEKFSVRGILELQWRHSEAIAKNKTTFVKNQLSVKLFESRKKHHLSQNYIRFSER